MAKKLLLFVFTLFLAARINAQSPQVSICNYLNNKSGAVSITFDDGCKDHFLIAQPILDNLGFEATFFIISNYLPGTGFNFGCSSNLSWNNLQNAVNKGHEIGSHTVHHSLLDTLYYKYGADTVESEIRKSRDTINKYVTGQKVVTFAYPEGSGGDNSSESFLVRKLLHKYYIGARTAGACQAGYDTYGYAMGSGFDDFYYQVESYPNSTSTTLSGFTQMLDGAIQDAGWFLPMYHTFNQNDNLSVTTADFTNQMNAINDRKNSLWVAPFREVLKYHKEKTSASVSISTGTASMLVVLTDTISNPEFDMPLTLKVSNIASNVHIDSIKQGTQKLQFRMIGNNIQFNAIPDRGTITIYKSTMVYSAPVVTTSSVSSISYTSASSGGNVTDDGNATVTSKGVCWSTSSHPTIFNSKTSDGGGEGSYTSSIYGLNPNTTYYIRSYASNSVGTSYGNELSFTTPVRTLPSVSTSSVSSITSSSASSGGNVTSDGGANVTGRGVCWNTSPQPTISASKSTNGTGQGSFTSSLSSLNTNTTYYVRAYAINSVGTAYGNEISFTTPVVIPTATLPILTTDICSSITSTSGSSGGNITDDGGSSISSRGVCWSTSASPTIFDNKTIDGTGMGLFTSTITNLASSTTYNVRAYATNSVGTAYGNQESFTTSLSTGIRSGTSNSNLSVYPNPSSGLFKLSFEYYAGDLLELKIINSEGVLVYKENLNQMNGDYLKDIDLKGVSKGVYCVMILTEKANYVSKVILE